MELPAAPAQELPGELPGRSPAMERLRAQLARAAGAARSTLLLEGPTGAGKSFAARWVHAASARSGGPLVTLTCAGWSLQSLEQELFGPTGLLAQATGGSLLLDEVGELPLELQATLVRLLEQRGRAGGPDVRILATTRLELRELAAAGRFRDDLYYRLNVLSARVPALAERPEDIDPLACVLAAGASGGVTQELTAPARARLRAHAWPGNVRELANVLERAVAAAGGGAVRVEHLGLEPQADTARPSGDAPLPAEERTLKAVEAAWIRRVLAECGGNRSLCAKVLGIHRATLHTKLRGFADASAPAGALR